MTIGVVVICTLKGVIVLEVEMVLVGVDWADVELT